MLNKKLTLTIFTCDKFSDLWDAHYALLEKFWKNRCIDTYIVTDNPTCKHYENAKIISAGISTELSQRVASVLPLINTEYILFTLDDYFLTESISSDLIESTLNIMEKEKLDYVRLFPMLKKNIKERGGKKLEEYNNIFTLDPHTGDYVISLYPGLWKKTFLEKTILKTRNAWQYEVALTKMACDFNAKCAVSLNNEFKILDVVRKGKLLNKANRYFKTNPVYFGDRLVMKRTDEFMIWLRTQLRYWLPQSIFIFLKKIMRKRGYVFFSDYNESDSD